MYRRLAVSTLRVRGSPIVCRCYSRVWRRHGNWHIYAYDLTSGKTFPIYRGDANQTEPAINDGVVVWTDDRKGNKDIYLNRKR